MSTTHNPAPCVGAMARPHAPRIVSVFGRGSKTLEAGRLSEGLPLGLRADDRGVVRDIRGGPFASRVVGRVCPAPREHTSTAGGSRECRPWVAYGAPERTASGWRVLLIDGRWLELETLEGVDHAPLCDHAAPIGPVPECGHRFVSAGIRAAAAALAEHGLSVRMVGCELGCYVSRFACEVSHAEGGRGFTIEYWRACDVYANAFDDAIPYEVVKIVRFALEDTFARMVLDLDGTPIFLDAAE